MTQARVTRQNLRWTRGSKLIKSKVPWQGIHAILNAPVYFKGENIYSSTRDLPHFLVLTAEYIDPASLRMCISHEFQRYIPSATA